MSSKSMYWNVNTLLRRGGVINVCCGGRGIGKSFSVKRLIIDQWIAKGWQGMYVRRYRDDLASFRTFFNDVAEYYPDWEFSVKDGVARGRRAGEDEPFEPICYSTSLSTAHKLKSSSYPYVHTILFDEFIAPPASRYLRDEVNCLYELYSTVDRYQDRVKVIMLANAISLDNPYFNAWGLDGDTEWQKYGGNFVVAQFPEAAKFMHHAESTRFGKFITNHEVAYAAYAMGNQFSDKSYAYIEPLPKGSKPVMAVRSPDAEVTLYLHDGKYWCCSGVVGEERFAVDCTPRDGEKPLARAHEIMYAFKQKWYNGSMVFDSIASRNAFRKLL